MSAVAMLNGGLGGDGDYRDRTARQKQYAQELEQQVGQSLCLSRLHALCLSSS